MHDARHLHMSDRKTTDYKGVGQSGYAAGRHDHDEALERDVHTRPSGYPHGADGEDQPGELALDDRFTGRGGPADREAQAAQVP